MNAVIACAIFSSISFMGYAISYFISPKMKNEFKRFGLKRYGTTVILFELLGALGLLFGLYFPLLLMISSLGLTVLMLMGVLVRIKVKDGFLVTLPAGFYMVLNAFIFWKSLS